MKTEYKVWDSEECPSLHQFLFELSLKYKVIQVIPTIYHVTRHNTSELVEAIIHIEYVNQELFPGTTLL